MFARRKRPVFIPTPELHARLAAVLKDYQELANSDPAILRLLIPSNEVWRFFIDGYRQKEGWLTFEKTEPGYLKAMYTAFQELFDFSRELNLDFFKRLHFLASSGVRNTNYDSVYYGDGELGQYRTDNDACGTYLFNINKKNCVTSQAGLKEILQRYSPHLSIGMSFPNNAYFHTTYFCDFVINKESLIAIRKLMADIKRSSQEISAQFILDRLQKFSSPRLRRELGSFKQEVLSSFIAHIKKLGETTTDDEASQYLYKMVRAHDEFCYYVANQPPDPVQETLHADMKRTLNDLKRDQVSAVNAMDRLVACVRFAHFNDQAHNHSDCNTRTGIMLAFQHLLMRYKLPPGIMHNPNYFDGKSLQELVKETIFGMENLFKLIKFNSLYNMKTSRKLDELSAKAQDCSDYYFKLAHFKEVVSIEEEGRDRGCKRKRMG